MLQTLWAGISVALQPINLLLALVGTTLGIAFGAMPGISSPLAISMMLPLVFGLDPAAGVVLLIGVYNGSVYGGSISAILLNTPGTPGSVATCLDGYQMTRRGLAGQALGASLCASFVGGVFSTLVLTLCLEPFARLSLAFGPSQMFLVIVLSFGMVARLSTGSTLKGWISAGIGVLLGSVGYDLISGLSRFTFGYLYLEDGFDLVGTLIGWFAIAEIVSMAQIQEETISPTRVTLSSILQGMRETLRHWRVLLSSSVLGAVVGITPGIGVATANLLAYAGAKSGSRNPDGFGQGEIEGVIAPEAANNAVTGSSLIPTLALGIPGCSSAAIIMGGLMILGVRPGPRLVTGDPRLTGAIMAGCALTNVAFLLVGLVLIGAFRYIARVRVAHLVPIILAIGCFGAYASRGYLSDMFFAVILGLFAYGLRKAHYNVACLVLGFVLARPLEEYFEQSLLVSGNGPLIFVQGSINISILLIGMLIYAYPYLRAFVTNTWKGDQK